MGDERARTRSLGQILSMRSCSIWKMADEKRRRKPDAEPLTLLRPGRLGCAALGLTSPFSLRIRRLNSLPSRQMKSSPGCRMPHLVAMALAVLMLSPVTIRTVMPARWHFLMASGTLREQEGRREVGPTAGRERNCRLVSCAVGFSARCSRMTPSS